MKFDSRNNEKPWSIKVPVDKGKYVTVYGGPYRDKPSNMFGVKMAAEIDKPCDVNIPTRDFSVPDETDLKNGLYKTYVALLEGKTVYVGCMGGIGRTGLFLACLVKLLGVENPVQYVRERYLSHAVETEEQKKYVNSMNFSLLSWFIWVRKMYSKTLRLGIYNR